MAENKEKPASPTDKGHGEGDEEEFVRNFPLSHGLTNAEAEELIKKYGKNELPDQKKSKLLLFCENLWQPMPIIIWIAAITEFAIGNYIDGLQAFP